MKPPWACSVCGRSFPGHAEYRVEITGWATAAAGKSIVAQRQTGRIACIECVEKAKRKIPPTQGQLGI